MSTDYFGAEPNPGQEVALISTYGAKELYNLIEKTVIEFKKSYDPDASPAYIFESVGMSNGVLKRFTEQDFETFASTKAEGGLVKRAKYGIGFHKDVIMKTIGLELSLTEESIKFNKWSDVTKLASRLGLTVPQRINLDMTHMAFTFANGTSYVDKDGYTIDTTTGDDLPIAYSAHKLAFSNITTTNIIPGNPPFSKSAVTSALVTARNNTLDNFGYRKQMNFTHIWCSGSQTNIEAIQQFLRSISDNTQANPNVENVYKNRFKLMVLQQLDTKVDGTPDTTKSNYWGIGAFEGNIPGSRFTAYYGQWEAPHMKPMPTDSNNANDYSRDIQKYGTRGRYGLAVLSGQGIMYSFTS